jgi:hypothetical protein
MDPSISGDPVRLDVESAWRASSERRRYARKYLEEHGPGGRPQTALTGST